ncbi:MAG: hypothetical protein OXE42_05045 [Gammaproteobacteria bacterium]|nr:hypothetical protein [Gammaproteobacteria bacterium]
MKAANEAKTAGDATPVTFDTLKAAQELSKAGFEDRQAGALVETISKAVSETVATKADLQLLRFDFDLLRSDFGLLRSEFELLRQSVDSRFDQVDSRFERMENKIVIKLGALMVTLTFVLLAIGPFYIRWVMSLLGS